MLLVWTYQGGAWEIVREHGRDMKLNGPLGRLSNGWENEITVEPKETGHKWLDWIHVAHDRGHWRAIVYSVIKEIWGSARLAAIWMSYLVFFLNLDSTLNLDKTASFYMLSKLVEVFTHSLPFLQTRLYQPGYASVSPPYHFIQTPPLFDFLNPLEVI